MDAVVAPLTLRRHFRRRLWGYSRVDVDRYVDEVVATNSKIRDELERVRVNADPIAQLSGDIASVLQALTDAVAAARERAEADADRLRNEARALVAEAEARAEDVRYEAATEAERRVQIVFMDACTRFAAVQQHRDTASTAVSRAVDALQAAMIALADVPAIPPVLGNELVTVD
jgi:cell division septum initiation protein DivIVA